MKETRNGENSDDGEFPVLRSNYDRKAQAHYSHNILHGSEIILSNETFFNQCFPIAFTPTANIDSLFTFLNLDFFHQIVTNLPYIATEIIRFLKKNYIRFSLKKSMFFSKKV